jgi:acyl-coenzyme A synthetase/AMP-(fatty) acid ligase
MALFTNICVIDSKPLFPGDIVDVLNVVPEPRTIVSTPVHLRALSSSDLDFPNVEIILCATSPLTQVLAQKVEQLFKGELHEVYGCSEVGSMAVRKTSDEERWLKFEGIHFSPLSQENRTTIIASTDYLEQSIQLGDQIELSADGHFHLLGRSSDMVDIAGKRGSLAEINKALLQFDGLIDGVVIFPEQDRSVPRLAAMVVLRDGYDKSMLKRHFRKYLDSVFVPRPIFCIDSLPREDNGKLARNKLNKLYTELCKRKN